MRIGYLNDSHPPMHSTSLAATTMYKRLLPLLMIALLSFTACTDMQEDAAEDYGEATEAAFEAEMTDFRNTMNASFAEADSELEELEARAANASEDVQAEYNEEIAELRQERMTLSQNLEQIEANTEEEWHQARANAQDEWNEFERDLTELRFETIETREEFEAAVNEEMTELDREMEELEAKSANASAEMKAEYEEQIAELEQERQEWATQWEQFENTTEENWQEMKSDLAASLSNFGYHMRNAGKDIERAFDPEGDLD